MYKNGKRKNMKYIIILEDDYFPVNDFENRLKKLLSYLELNNDWDIFLGVVKKCNKIFNKTRIFDEDLYYICVAHSTHLFICYNSLYDILLEVDKTKYAVDTFWHKKYRVCILLPFLAFQHN